MMQRAHTKVCLHWLHYLLALSAIKFELGDPFGKTADGTHGLCKLAVRYVLIVLIFQSGSPRLNGVSGAESAGERAILIFGLRPRPPVGPRASGLRPTDGLDSSAAPTTVAEQLSS